MITLTKEQKALRKRIKGAIDTEIGMCDDYADLMVLATVLYDSSKRIFNVYSKEFGDDATKQALKYYRK